MNAGSLRWLAAIVLVLVLGAPASATYWFAYNAHTTGVYDEQTNNLNSVDFEMKAGSLAKFKIDVAAAYANNLGGVVDFTKPNLLDVDHASVTANGKYGTPSGAIGDPFVVELGVSLANSVTIHVKSVDDVDCFDVHTRKYDDSSLGVPALSGTNAGTDKYWADSLITSNRYESVLGTCYWEFVEPKVVEFGITALTANYSTQGNTRGTGTAFPLQLKATYSDNSTETLTTTIGDVTGAGNDDTFFYFKAPPGQTIKRIDADDTTHTGLIAFDDLGIIIIPEPATMGLLALGGVGLLLRRKQK